MAQITAVLIFITEANVLKRYCLITGFFWELWRRSNSKGWWIWGWQYCSDLFPVYLKHQLVCLHVCLSFSVIHFFLLHSPWIISDLSFLCIPYITWFLFYFLFVCLNSSAFVSLSVFFWLSLASAVSISVTLSYCIKCSMNIALHLLQHIHTWVFLDVCACAPQTLPDTYLVSLQPEPALLLDRQLNSVVSSISLVYRLEPPC